MASLPVGWEAALTSPRGSSLHPFLEFIASRGFQAPATIQPGELIRFPGLGKPLSNSAGWAKLFPCGAAGVLGDWATNYQETWRSSHVNSSPKNLRHEIKAAREQLAHERTLAYERAAEKAAYIWDTARPATIEHPYLARKALPEPYGARVFKTALVVPLLDTEGYIVSLQFINEDGSKKFLRGGRIKGCYFPIGFRPDGEPPPHLALAEGYATAATVHLTTALPVAVTFNTGNLMSVARVLRSQFPSAKLTFYADDDWRTPGNPGLAAASAAAAEVCGEVVAPCFPPGCRREKYMTEFNDLYILRQLHKGTRHPHG